MSEKTLLEWAMLKIEADLLWIGPRGRHSSYIVLTREHAEVVLAALQKKNEAMTEKEAYLKILEPWLRDHRELTHPKGSIEDLGRRIAIAFTKAKEEG